MTTKNSMKIRTTLLNGKFKLCDHEGTLKLFSEPAEDGRKGLVYEGNREVMKPFPHVAEKTLDQAMVSFTDTLLEEARVWDHHEGCLVRVYWSSQGWRVSTQKKIDAFSSRWGSRTSFGESWVSALPCGVGPQPKTFFDGLNRTYQYLFIVSNNEDNRIVCDAPEVPEIVHVGTWVNDKLVHNVDVGIPMPREYKLASRKELNDHFNQMDWTKVTGTLVLSQGSWTKIHHPEYSIRSKIRNNEPSLPFRYLQLRLDCEKTNMLYNLFPQFSEKFDLYEDTIYEIAQFLHTSYMNRFVHKQFVTVDREFYPILRLCHEWHTQDRKNNKVSLDKVIEIINSRYDHVLNKMIRTFLRNQKDLLRERPALPSNFVSTHGEQTADLGLPDNTLVAVQ